MSLTVATSSHAGSTTLPSLSTISARPKTTYRTPTIIPRPILSPAAVEPSTGPQDKDTVAHRSRSPPLVTHRIQDGPSFGQSLLHAQMRNSRSKSPSPERNHDKDGSNLELQRYKQYVETWRRQMRGDTRGDKQGNDDESISNPKDRFIEQIDAHCSVSHSIRDDLDGESASGLYNITLAKLREHQIAQQSAKERLRRLSLESKYHLRRLQRSELAERETEKHRALLREYLSVRGFPAASDSTEAVGSDHGAEIGKPFIVYL